jgi:hypothetical protein
MNHLKRLYIIVLMSFYFINNAQTLLFENYTTKDGLISDDVYKLHQDKNGYIWIFTNYGTMKYNGKTFQSVLNNLSFNESFIYAFYESEDGRFFVANSNCKIYEIINDSAFQVTGTEKMSLILKNRHVIVSEFVISKNGDIYVPSTELLLKFCKKQVYEEEKISQTGYNDSIYGSVIDVDGNLVFSIFNYLKYFKKSGSLIDYKIQFVNIQNKVLKRPPFQFREYNFATNIPSNFKKYKNEIIFSFYFNVFKVSASNKVKVIPFKSYVLNYTTDANGHLWVATLNNGLYELNKNDSILNHYFPNKTINHVLFDSQNRLWISTEGLGLFCCKKLQQLHYNNEGNNYKSINFIKKIDRHIVLANANGDVFLLEGNKKYSYRAKEKSEVLDVLKLNESFIIVNRYRLDLLTVHQEKVRVISLPLIKPGFHPQKLYKLGNDSILAFSNFSFIILKDGLKSLNKVQFKIQSKHKLFSFKLRKNQMLFATEDGVFEYINKQFVRPKYLDSTVHHKITGIEEDLDHNFWFFSKGNGMFKLSPNNELIHYTIKNGLPSDIINDMSFSTDSGMLLSTNRGLYQSFYKKKWNEIYSEQVKKSFSYKNDIYILTKYGLVLNKSNIIKENNNVYFNLSSIQVNNSNSNIESILKLDYNQNNLVFNFDIISNSFNLPDIYYELKGNKTELGLTKNQQIVLKNLEPASYTLKVNLASRNISYAPIIIKFSIKPAFWQTKLFIFICIVLMLFLIGVFLYLIIRYYKNKDRLRSETDRIITEYKLIALKAQINPHFMSNCLTAIQQLIYSKKLQEANQYIAKFSFLVRQVLNFSSKNLVKLHEELELATLNMELELLRFEDKFTYKIEIDTSIDSSVILLPPLILQPLIENSIWHGLLPLNNIRKGILMIKIKEVGNGLKIFIEDNGVGINNSKSSKIGNLKESKGIEITKQRIMNLNISNSTTIADIHYEEVIDFFGNIGGTRVVVVLPLIKIAENEMD